MKTFKEILTIINHRIDSIDWNKYPKGLYQPIGYILSLGGKRIRPALVLMSANLYQEDMDGVMDIAIGLEIFHNFTLLHDDIMDKADIRRGNPTVHKKWSDNTAILSGDVMQIEAYKWVSKVKEDKLGRVITLFSKMAAEVCEGQQLDMEFENQKRVDIETYLEMIKLKTAVLLATSCQLGGYISGATSKDEALLYEFGLNLGMAFQLKDDLLDVYGNENSFGKKIGGDILCNKKTFLLINALNLADKSTEEELNKWLETTDRDCEKIKSITEIYNKLEIKELCEKKIEEYLNKAKQNLSQIDVPKEKKREFSDLILNLSKRID